MTTYQEARKRLRSASPTLVRTGTDQGPLSYYLIGGAGLLLLIIGVVMVLSASTIVSIRDNGNPYADFMSQARFVLVGVPLLLLATRIPVAWYRRLAWAALLVGMALQLLILTPLGRGGGGNLNWIYIPGIGQTIQPSEFLKLGLALWLGYVLSAKRDRLREPGQVLRILVVCGAALGLVLVGKDMGTALVFIIMIAGALFIAGLPMVWFAGGGVLGLVGIAALVFSSPSRMARVMEFLGMGNPDPTGAGYQSRHGLWGLGTGGLTGVGLGASREKWAYLPEAHNDFIFAVLGEELGLIGTLVVLILFAVLAGGLLRMIRRHPDPFVKITTAAVACWIIGQAVINVGVVVGALPVIGVPLPLVSAGGSAMISTLLALGIMLAFARSEPGASAGLAVSAASVRQSLAVVGGRLVGRRGGSRPSAGRSAGRSASARDGRTARRG